MTGTAGGFTDGMAFWDPRGLPLPREGAAAATAGDGDGVDCACAGGIGGVALAGAGCSAADRGTAVSSIDPRGLPLPEGGADETVGDGNGVGCTGTIGAGGVGFASTGCGGTAVSTVDPRALPLLRGDAAATIGDGDGADCAGTDGTSCVGLAGGCCGAAERDTTVSSVAGVLAAWRPSATVLLKAPQLTSLASCSGAWSRPLALPCSWTCAETEDDRRFWRPPRPRPRPRPLARLRLEEPLPRELAVARAAGAATVPGLWAVWCDSPLHGLQNQRSGTACSSR